MKTCLSVSKSLTRLALSTAALALALFVAGCESDGGIAARTREKSAAYASLKISEKRFVDRGIIAIGFTPDMVYMAMGKPTKIESKPYPEGTRELWTYSRYYPNYDAGQGFSTVPYSTEGHYQRSHFQGPVGSTSMPNGMDRNQGQPLNTTGGPQGASSGEPADLQSFTFMILFKEGKVARFGIDADVN